MATIPVEDANGATVNVELPLVPGRAAAAASRPVVLSTEDLAALAAISNNVALMPGEYETVAASATAQVLGATGAVADYLGHIIVQPTSTAPGAVTVLDNAIAVYVYPGGTVDDGLKPFVVPINLRSVSGAWRITTGVNVTALAVGQFT